MTERDITCDVWEGSKNYGQENPHNTHNLDMQLITNAID